jgi:hypothetical protein
VWFFSFERVEQPLMYRLNAAIDLMAPLA